MSSPLPRLRSVASLLFWMLVLASVIGVLSVLSGRRLFDRIDEEIRMRAEAELAACFPELSVRVGAAKRVEGSGILLRNVQWREFGDAQAVAAVERLMIRCETDLTAWARGELAPTSLEAVGVRLRIRQEDDGQWASARRLLPVCDDDQAPIPLLLREVEAELRVKDAAAPLRLTDSDVDLLPHYVEGADYPHLRLIGRLGRGERSLRVEGRLDPRRGVFKVVCQSGRHRLSPQLLAAAARMGAPLAQLQVRGTLLDIRSVVTGGVGRPLAYQLSGTLRDGRVEHPELPASLDNVELSMRIDTRQIEIRDLRATAAGAALAADHIRWSPDSRSLAIDADIRDLRFDERLAEGLPGPWREVWAKHHALGAITHAHWTYESRGEEGVVRNLLDVACRDLSFHFDALPYRFHRAEGRLQLRGRRLGVSLEAPVSGERVTIVGDVLNVGGDGPYGWIEVETAAGAVPLDADMIDALEPRVQNLVRSFRPRGTLKVKGRMERPAPHAPLRRQTHIQLEDLAVSFDKLPYPVDRIRGTMTMIDGRWTFDVTGRNDSAQIACRGGWDPKPADGRHLKLRFDAAQVALDAELRQSLSQPMQRLWQRINPRGTLDHVAVDFHFDALNRKPATRVTAWKLPREAGAHHHSPRLSVRPRGLPYELDHVTGKLVLNGSQITLDGLRAVHGASVWEAQGRCLREGAGWTADFSRLIIDNLVVDRELLSALPASLAPAVSRLQLRGPMDIDGRLALRGDDRGDGPRVRRAGWDLNIDVEQGSMRLGQLPLDKVRGQLQVRGAAEDGRLAANGQLDIDSLRVRGINVRQLRGPISINNERVRLGSWAATPQPRQLKAQVFGGTIGADAELRLDDSRRFDLAASLSNGQLSQIAHSAVPVGGKIEGQASGTVLLSGTTRGVHSFSGEGFMEMTDADIYEVPVMVTLLNLLSARELDRSLISHGEANFRVVGDRIYLDQLELDGAMRLRGSGDVNLQRQINLNLYTAMGGEAREGGPPLPWLFREASRRILEIEVAGTLDQPAVTRRAFPEINDTLQRLFPEAAGRRGVASMPALRGRLQR